MIQILPTEKQNCCGCSACEQICPQGCISMKEDGEGFRYPIIDTSECIGCNLCETVCPIMKEKNCDKKKDAKQPKAIGGWHKNEKVRSESSSGGAFTLFAEYVLSQGGVVYGCALNDNLEAEHIGIETIEDLVRLKGSKYVQSDMVNAYSEIKDQLIEKRKVLFVGTPCQCAGLSEYLERVMKTTGSTEYRKNLYICDFICHGVPSPKVFRSYIQFLEEKYGDKIKAFRFRNKDKGWSPTGLQMGTKIEFSKIESKRFAPAFRDAYMNGFLDDVYLRPSCYNCEFKSMPKYYADITIADFWGVNNVAKELDDGKGTSLLLIHTQSGQKLFEAVKDNFLYKEVEFEAAIRRNKSLIRSAATSPRRERFFYEYEQKPFDKIRRKYMSAFSWAFHKLMKIGWNIIKGIIKSILNPVLRIVHQEWDDAKWEGFFQFIKFAMVGVSNTVVSYTINVTTLFLLRKLQLSFDYVIANLTAFILSVLWSYHWNSTYVFHPEKNGKGAQLKTLLKTYASYGFSGIILNNALATIWIQVLGISKYISPLLNLPFSMTVNFFMQKRWAYREKK